MNQMGVIFDQFDRLQIKWMQSRDMEPIEFMLSLAFKKMKCLGFTYFLQAIIISLFFVSCAFWSQSLRG